MNRSYGQYGHWSSGRSFGYSPAAQAVLNQQGMTITESGSGFDQNAIIGTGGQVVSSLSTAGAGSQKKGVRAVSASGKTVAGAAALVGTAAAMGAPLNAVPVAGQIAFAAVVVGAATFAFIKAMRAGRISNKKADQLAKKYGLDSDLKKYVRKVMRMKKTKRLVELAKQKRRYKQKSKGGFFKKVKTLTRSKKRMKEKIDILRQVIEFDKAEARAKAAAKRAGASDAQIAASLPPDQSGIGGAIAGLGSTLESVGIPSQALLPLGLGLGALVLFLIFRRGGS